MTVVRMCNKHVAVLKEFNGSERCNNYILFVHRKTYSMHNLFLVYFVSFYVFRAYLVGLANQLGQQRVI